MSASIYDIYGERDLLGELWGCTDSSNPDQQGSGFGHFGIQVISGVKTNIWRQVWQFDLSAVAGMTITSVEFRANVELLTGLTGRASTLRRITETFTSEFTWNDRDWPDTSWGNIGPSPPNSATDTDAVAFTSPTVTGWQDVVTGLKTLADDAIANRSNKLRFVMRMDNELPGGTAYCLLGTPPYLRVTVEESVHVAEFMGVPLANIQEALGVAESSVSEIMGESA